MVPLRALATLDPLLAVGNLRLSTEVNLFAEVAILVFLVCIGAELAKPGEAALVKLAALPEILFIT